MKKIILTGNVGKDPELRADQNGGQFAIFSMGVSVGTKQSPKTDWAQVICNGKLADIAKSYIKKGSKILVEGFPSASAYINRENKAVSTLRVYANNIELLSRREDECVDDNQGTIYSSPSEIGAEESHHAMNELMSDDIPF